MTNVNTVGGAGALSINGAYGSGIYTMTSATTETAKTIADGINALSTTRSQGLGEDGSRRLFCGQPVLCTDCAEATQRQMKLFPSVLEQALTRTV